MKTLQVYHKNHKNARACGKKNGKHNLKDDCDSLNKVINFTCSPFAWANSAFDEQSWFTSVFKKESLIFAKKKDYAIYNSLKENNPKKDVKYENGAHVKFNVKSEATAIVFKNGVCFISVFQFFISNIIQPIIVAR